MFSRLYGFRLRTHILIAWRISYAAIVVNKSNGRCWGWRKPDQRKSQAEPDTFFQLANFIWIFGERRGGDGSLSRTRTYDPAINSRLLYQLSYQGSPHRGQCVTAPVDEDAYNAGQIHLPSPEMRFFHPIVIFLSGMWKTSIITER